MSSVKIHEAMVDKTAGPTRPLSFTEPRGARDSTSPVLEKWYFAVNGEGLRNEFSLIKVAVTSALTNTKLKPHCIYDGPDCEQLNWLEAAGVTVIRHKPKLAKELKEAYGEKYKTFRGHWLRVDLGSIDRFSVVALYTDIDVMFLSDPSSYSFKPKFLAVCEEHEVGIRTHFNSGSMIINFRNFRTVNHWFLKNIRYRLENQFKFPPHDQRSFNDFFLDVVDWMEPKFNWKPYWGYNPDACIVHFHGPKPNHVARILAGHGDKMKSAYVTIYNRSPAGYKKYVELYEHFLIKSEDFGKN